MSFYRFPEDEVDLWFKKGDVNNDGLISSTEYQDWEKHMKDCGIIEEVDIRSFSGYIHLNYNLNIFLLSLTVQG